VLALFAARPLQVRADDPTARARAFLESASLAQRALAGSQMVDAAEVADALEPSAALDVVRLGLSFSVPDNHQAALLRIGALAGAPFGDPGAAAAEFVALMAGDAGLARGSAGADPLVLASAVRACARQACGADVLATLIASLAACQHADGSFSFADNDGDIAVTAEVARALGSVVGSTAAQAVLEPTVAWLRAQIPGAVLPVADLALALTAISDADPALAAALVTDLMARQEASGAFDAGDVRATALAVQALRRGLPDLVVAVAPVQSEATTGAPATLKLYVTNGGRTPSPATTLQASVRDGAGATVWTSTAIVPPLAAGSTTTLLADLGMQGVPGARVATFVANPGQDFAEGDFSNNALTWNYTVKDLADLVIEPGDIALSPSPAVLYQASRISVRVRNIGVATEQNVHVQLFDGDPIAGGRLMSEAFFNAVAASTPRVLMASWIPGDLQAHTFFARVDPEGSVREVSKANNQASITFTANNPADFVIDLHAFMSSSGTSINQGDPLTVTFGLGGLISRFGNPYPDAALWPFRAVAMDLYQGTPGVLGTLIWHGAVGIQPCPNNMPWMVCDVAYPSEYRYGVNTNALTGTLQFTVILDPDNVTSDIKLSDNVVVQIVDVKNPGLAELWVDPASIRSDPGSVPTTGTATVHATIANTGVIAANDVRVDLVWPSRTSSLILPMLAPGQTSDVQFAVAASDLQLGNNGRIVVDPLNAIPEPSKANNSAPISLRASNVNYTLTMTTNPSPAPADQTVDVVVSLRNDGAQSFSPGYVSMSGEGQSGYQNDTSYLSPGQTKIYHFPFSTAGKRGSISLGVSIQYGASYATLPIANADLAISPAAISLEPAAGNTVIPIVTVNNLGNLTATTSIRVYRGYPEQGDRASAGTVMVPAAGSAVWRGPAFALASQAPFAVSAIVDEENALTELDETNNFATISAKPKDSLVVVFDETHGPGSTIGTNMAPGTGGVTAGLADFAKDLEARGYHVTTADPDGDGLTPNKLLADVVVMDGPDQAYSGYELRLLRDFVEQRGGGVFLLGDWGGGDPGSFYNAVPVWQPVIDQLTATFGFSFVHDFVFAGGYCSTNSQVFDRSAGAVRSHPITSGVNGVFAQYVGGFASLPAGANVLLQSPSNWQVPNVVVGGTFALGAGRVGFHGDANLMDADFSGPTQNVCPWMFDVYRQRDNRRYALQMVDWLAKGGPRDWLPDLAFSPASLTVDKNPITSGDVVTLTGAVRNIGGALPPGASTVVRLFDGPASSGKLLAELPIPPLTSDEPVPISFTWDTTGLSGAHTLTAVIDPDGLVAEYSKDNNVLAVPIAIRAGVDLRVEPVDVSFPVTGGVAVTVHNLGYSATMQGRAQVTLTDDAAQVVSVALPSVLARGAVTVTIPWTAADPTVVQGLTIVADPVNVFADVDPTNQTVRVTVAPPRIDLYAPVDNAIWGGTKTFRWSFTSDEFPDAIVSLALGSADQALTGQFIAKPPSARPQYAFDLDTTKLADGVYRARITADGGVVKGVREVVFRIDNSGTAVRTFSTSQLATAAIGQPGATAQVVLPAGVYVDSATALLDVQEDPYEPVVGVTVGTSSGAAIVQGTDRLVATYQLPGSAELMSSVSLDGGATWSGAVRASHAGANAGSVLARSNASGFHVFYVSNGSLYHSRSADGFTWTPVSLSWNYGFGVDVRDDGLTLVSLEGMANGTVKLYSAPPDGSGWSAPVSVPGFTTSGPVLPTVSSGRLRLYENVPYVGIQYRESSLSSDLTKVTSWSIPVTVTPATTDFMVFDANGRLDVLYSVPAVIGGNVVTSTYLQRCRWESDCTTTERWLPAPVKVASSPLSTGWRNPDQLQATWSVSSLIQVDGGARFGRAMTLESGVSTAGSACAFGGDSMFLLSPGSPLTVRRWPGFAPAQSSVDIGGDGPLEWADAGPRVRPGALPDFAAALNAYVASHANTIINGQITVPIAVVASGPGKLVIRDLEIRHRPLGTIAALADPPLISPQASPGVLDTAALSTTASAPIVLFDVAGRAVRTLVPSPSGARYAASFDGRDDSGVFLASGVYAFGPASAPATVEIDDIPPVIALSFDASGLYGGRAQIHGTATDADYAGSSKNFSRYVLEYTVDGATYTQIATSTVPVTSGLLGTWDTRCLASQPFTLRLTAYDRAGNSSVTARTVNVSPAAPQAPTITAPTVAGAPVDSTSPLVTVGGAAEPGTMVTVNVNGAAVGTTASNGQWSLAGVPLPAGIASITAAATRNGLQGQSAQPIQVGNYALAVAVTAPPHSVTGSQVTATVSIARTSVRATPLGVRLTIKDSTNQVAPIDASPAQQVLNLAGLGSASFDVTLSTAKAPPGTYQIVAEVISGGLVPASATSTLVLDPASSVTATLVSDRAVYNSLQLVALTARVLNGPSSVETGPLSATITIFTPLGAAALLGPYALGSIPSGAFASLGALYGEPPLAVGTYLADLAVTDGTAAIVARASTSFDVEVANGVGELAGTLNVTPTTYVPGDVLAATFTVTNRAADAQVPVSVLLIDQATSAVVARFDQPMSIPKGATVPGAAALSTSGAPGAALIALLIGNGRGLAAQAIDPPPFCDTTPPVIAIDGVAEGEYRRGSITPVITVTDPESAFTWEAELNGEAFTSGTKITADRAYDLIVHARNVFGRTASAARHFTIDTAPPDVSVSGVAPDEMTRFPVTPTVTYGDLHLRSSSLTLNGEAFFSGTTVAIDGDYALVAFADDLAGNSTTVPVSFTIDQTPPLIGISGVIDGELTNQTVFPVVQVTELHPDSESVTLDGPRWDGLPVVTDGTHVLTVNASDLAGNPAQALVQFTIDKTPPKIVVSGVASGASYRIPVSPIVAITDEHPRSSTVLLDGMPFASGAPVVGDGYHRLHVEADDMAGNASVPVDVDFTMDATPPVITITGVTDGLLTRGSLTPVVTVTDAHPGLSTTLLDGNPFVSGTLVAAEGIHSLRVDATDALGNAASPAIVGFTIDRTTPVISVNGVADGCVYYNPVTITFAATDAHLGPPPTATLDGAAFASGGNASGIGTHALIVTAADAAGNTATTSLTFRIDAIDATLAVSLDSRPRVLVGLNCGGQPASCQNTQAGFLLSVLAGAGIPYDVALDTRTFLNKIRGHFYNVRVLYRTGSSDSGTYDELRETTYAGSGLVIVNDASADNDPKLSPVIGLSFGGTIKSVGTVAIAAGDLGAARTVTVTGGGISETKLAAGANGIGTTTSSRYVVITTYRYGAGRTATLSFNPEASATQAMKDLLLSVVQFAAGGAIPAAVPGSPQHIQFTAHLNAPAGPLTFDVSGTPATGLTLVSAPGITSTSPPTWALSLEAGYTVMEGMTVQTSTPGTYPVYGELDYTGAGGPSLVASGHVDIVIAGNIASLKTEAINAVTAIPPNLNDNAKNDALAKLSSVYAPPTTRAQADQSITATITAASDVTSIVDQEAIDARVKIDALLRALEVLSITLP